MSQKLNFVAHVRTAWIGPKQGMCTKKEHDADISGEM